MKRCKNVCLIIKNVDPEISPDIGLQKFQFEYVSLNFINNPRFYR